MILPLPDVTLVLLAGNHTAPSNAALADTLSVIAPEQVLEFRDSPETPFRSVADATRIAWREVLPRLTTTHVLSCHWDGYPVRSEAWDDAFRQFDYIGAVWPWFTERSVGNSGFSLQSRRFLEVVRDIPMKQPEDITLCRDLRGHLEAQGIRFAPESVADRFSVEHGPANPRSFGFHGVWNFLYHMDDEAIKARLGLIDRSQWTRDQIDTLAQRALIGGRRELYRWVNAKRVEVLKG